MNPLPSDEITDEMRDMARTIIPTVPTHALYELMELAVCHGMLLERGRVRREAIERKFLAAVGSVQAMHPHLAGDGQ